MKLVKAFITDDRYTSSSSNTVSEVLEISDYSLTFSKERKIYTSTLNSNFSLQVFKLENATNLTETEVNNIVQVVEQFIDFLFNTNATDKATIIASFVFNLQTSTSLVVTNFNYNTLINHNGKRIPDYLSFILNNEITINLWLRDYLFREFYPHYNIDVVFPFDNFSTIVNSPTDMINSLNSFNIVNFNTKIEQEKNNRISTHTVILNIPYKVPNTTILKDCYFAFIIYGQQGNYEFILRLTLFEYLRNILGLSDVFIQSIFPSILEINEFFIIPRWLKIAIPSHVNQSAINSQVTLTYNEPFDLNKFITIYDNDHLIANTYSVPIEYNNMLLLITNGKYTQTQYKDFLAYYSDILAITTIDPDFGRMSTRTQQFITLLENMIITSNVNNSTELLNKVIQNTNYDFNIINRNNIEYLSVFFDKHQYYMLPKYEYIRLNV